MTHKPSGKNHNCLADMICPECGNENELIVEAKTFVSLTDDGTDAHADSLRHFEGPEWGENSVAVCPQCDFSSTVGDFTYSEDGKSAAIKNTAESILREFVADVDSVGANHLSDEDGCDWPDLRTTYEKAKAFLEKL